MRQVYTRPTSDTDFFLQNNMERNTSQKIPCAKNYLLKNYPCKKLFGEELSGEEFFQQRMILFEILGAQRAKNFSSKELS
jgi:hypothetical protein